MTITKEQLKILKALYDLGMRYLYRNPVFKHQTGIVKDELFIDVTSEKIEYDESGFITMGAEWSDMEKEGYHSLFCPFVCIYELMKKQKSPFPFYKLFEKEDK